MDMGPYVSTGFGLAPRPDDQIAAYFAGIGCPLRPWEFRAVRRMCRAYLSGLQSSSDKFSIPPMDRPSAMPPECP